MSSPSPSARPLGAGVIHAVPSNDVHWWFTALDQRSFLVGAERWFTQVVGIHQAGGDVWIQLESLGEELREFIVCVRPGMSVDDVVVGIEARIREAA